MKKCVGCEMSLYGDLAFCPYCSKRDPLNVGAAHASPATAAMNAIAAHADSAKPTTSDRPAARSGARTDQKEATVRSSRAGEARPIPPSADRGERQLAAKQAIASTNKGESSRQTVAPVDVSIASRSAALRSETAPVDDCADLPERTATFGKTATPFSEAVTFKKPRRKWGRIAFISGLVIGAIFITLATVGLNEDKQAQLCKETVASGMQALQADDLTSADAARERAVGACAGDLSVHISPLASALHDARRTEMQCASVIDGINARIADARPAEAMLLVKRVPAACADSKALKAALYRINETNAAADAAAQRVRTALQADDADADADAAAEAIDALARIDRAQSSLSLMRAQLARLRARRSEAAQTMSLPQAGQSSSVPSGGNRDIHVPTQAQVARAPQAATPVNTATQAAAEDFLRDAEGALAKGQFDSARTYVESARRMDPTNSRLNGMLETIRRRERQVLQDDTAIR